MTMASSAFQGPGVRRSAESWTLKDLMAIATLMVMAFSVVVLPLLPISPTVIFPFFLLAFCLKDLRSHLPTLIRNPALILYMLLVSIQLLGGISEGGLNYETVAKSGRILASAVFVLALCGYVLGKPDPRFNRVVVVFLVALGTSALWFLSEITVIEPFVSWRLALYADIYEGFLSPNAEDTTRSGLSPFLHTLGYQLSFFLSISLVLQTEFSKFPVKALRLVALVLGFTALYFSSQRSAFFSVALTVMIFFVYLRSIKQSLKLLLGLVLGAASLLVVTSSGSWETDYLQESVTKKLIGPEYWSEAMFRLRLQSKAVELVIANPLGLPDMDDEWLEQGFYPVFRESESVVISGPIAVHNGYLGLALQFGLPFFILTLWFLFELLRITNRVLKSSSNFLVGTPAVVQSVVAAGPGIFLLQSATHNSSLFTQDASCLVMFCLILASDVLRRKAEAFTNDPQNIVLR